MQTLDPADIEATLELHGLWRFPDVETARAYHLHAAAENVRLARKVADETNACAKEAQWLYMDLAGDHIAEACARCARAATASDSAAALAAAITQEAAEQGDLADASNAAVVTRAACALVWRQGVRAFEAYLVLRGPKPWDKISDFDFEERLRLFDLQ